jgi:hypothetical protein
MASANPSVRATLARTVSIAQVNFLPLSFVSFVTALPFTPLSLPDVYQYANDALGRPVFDSLWLAFGSSLFTFALYGVFSGARGRQVRFVECLTKGVSLALPVICQTFFLYLLAGAHSRGRLDRLDIVRADASNHDCRKARLSQRNAQELCIWIQVSLANLRDANNVCRLRSWTAAVRRNPSRSVRFVAGSVVVRNIEHDLT